MTSRGTSTTVTPDRSQEQSVGQELSDIATTAERRSEPRTQPYTGPERRARRSLSQRAKRSWSVSHLRRSAGAMALDAITVWCR